MKRIAFACLLLPCLATAGDFETRWRARVALFERENAALDPAQRTVVLLGSSSMEGWRHGDRAGFLPEGRRFLNRGISGDGIGLSRTTGIKNRLRASVYDCQPSHVFLLNGRNSIGRDGARVERTAQVYREVLESIQREQPGVVVCVITCAPVNKGYAVMAPHVARFNQRITAIAEELGCPVIDLHALLVGDDGLLPRSLTNDGLHFKDAGYRTLAGEIARVLRETPAPSGEGQGGMRDLLPGQR